MAKVAYMVKARKREGFPGKWRVGRFWSSSEFVEVDYLTSDEVRLLRADPEIEIKSGGKAKDGEE